MAFNLDFSAWNEARRARANAILADAQARADAKKTQTAAYAKMISGLGQVAAGLFKEEDGDKKSALDFGQFLSANNLLDKNGNLKLSQEQLDELTKRFRGGF